MVYKLAVGIKEKIDGPDSIRPVYREEFITRGMSSVSAKAAWLLYFENMVYSVVWSLDSQDALLTQCSSLLESVLDEGRVPPAASADAYAADDDDCDTCIVLSD